MQSSLQRAAIAAAACAVLMAGPAAAYTVYVSNEKGNSITVLDSETFEVLETIPVGQRPRGIMLTKDGKHLLICASDDDTIQVLDVATRYSELGEALLPIINPILSSKYGIELGSFIVENVSVPPEVEAAIDKRSSMAAVGNLNDFVKFQMAQGMAQGGGPGVGGIGAELAVGMAMAQQMINQPGGIMAQTTPPAAPPSGAGVPELLSPAEAATVLGVSEADVIASLDAGDLKGKKIGTQWRITRAALSHFLQ